MFTVPLLGVLSPVKLSTPLRMTLWLILSFGVIILIGFRYKIGGDWINYYEAYLRIDTEGFGQAVNSRSIGYGIINWVSSLLGFGIAGVNTFCAVFFVAGLSYFCRKQPSPYLAWLVATPYMIVVVAMGYTAQSVALGMVMVAYICLSERRVLLFFLFVGIAYLFHKSGIIVLPLALTLIEKDALYRWVRRLSELNIASIYSWLLIAVIFLCGLLLLREFSGLYKLIDYYVFRGQWESGGGLYRVLLNVVPGLVLLFSRQIFGTSLTSERIWKILSCISLIMVPLVFWQSTLIDRVSLYLIPLQLYVWSRVPFLISNAVIRSTSVLVLCGMYAFVFWGWLKYSNHYYEWIPYDNFFLL